MKSAKIISALLTVFLLISALPAAVFAAEGDVLDDLRYKKTDDGIEVTGYDGTEKELIIPGTIEDLPVISVSFIDRNESVEKLVIPEGVKTVGPFTYYSNYNYHYNLPEIKEIVIPDSAETIANNAFYGCKKLEKAVMSKKLKTINANAFRDCVSLTSAVLPEGLTYIGSNAFRNCVSLKEVTLPGSLGLMDTEHNEGSHAEIFRDCTGLKKVVISEGIQAVPPACFTGCAALEELYLPSTLTSIYWGTFCGCSSLKEVTVPNEVVKIGSTAFAYCYSLEKITLGDKLKQIGGETFRDCALLKNVDLPDSLTEILDYAFAGCRGITGLNIPKNVNCIESGAFARCSSLATITVADGNERFSSTGNCLIKNNEKMIICGCSNSVIPDDGSVTMIGTAAFADVMGLKELNVPASVTYINYDSFDGCGGLQKITVADGNAKFHAVGNCLIDTANKKIIRGCSNSVIPEDGSVTSIGGNAFTNCVDLKNFVLPSFVEDRYFKSAFNGCTGIETIEVNKNNKKFIAKNDCVISISDKSVVFGCKNSLIPDDGSVTIIGSGAFYGCAGLEEMTIPETIVTIESTAFSNCDNLRSLTVPGSVLVIGDAAFGIHGYMDDHTPASKIDGFKVICYAGSKAAEYAEANGLDCEFMASPKIEIKDISPLYIKGAFVLGISPGMTVVEFAEQFKNDVTVRDAKNQTVTDGDLGTGFKAVVDDAEVIAVVSGDTDGNGRIDSTDYICVKRHFLRISSLGGAYGRAADTDGNGVIDATDYIAIKRHILGVSEL